jgi:2'-5' RNA ligase
LDRALIVIFEECDIIQLMRHRIFIAINLPDEIKNQLIFYQRKLSELPIMLTKMDNLHITLIFIGYIDDAETAKVCQIVKEAASGIPTFSLKLNKIFFGPPGDYGPESGKAPRMVWVEGEKSQELAFLKNQLEKSLISTNNSGNANSGKRAFSPHITLGRIKQWDWRKIEPEERPNINEEISLNFKVSSVEVMESRLKRGGPEYTILESAELIINDK